MLAKVAFTIGFSPTYMGGIAAVIVGMLVVRSFLGQGSGRGLAGVTGMVLLGVALTSIRFVPAPDQLALALSLAVACLLLAIALALRGWMFRRSVWLQQPQRLIETPPPPSILVSLGFLLAVGTVWFAIGSTGAWFASWATLLAGIGACVLGHLARRIWVAGIGLWIIGCGVFLLFRAGGWSPLVSLAITSAYMLWLSGFWHQQLLGTYAWTTTGQLIPWARFGAVLFGIFTAQQALWPLAGSEHWFGLLLVFALTLLLFKDGLTGFFALPPAVAWLLAGTLFSTLLGPDMLEWATVFVPAEQPSIELDDPPGPTLFYLTPGFALGGLLLIGRRVLAGQREPVSAAANQLLLPALAVADMAFAPIVWVSFAWMVPVTVLDLLTNRAPALAETPASSSNP